MIHGRGIELGLLDTFFYRNGFYDDSAGYVTGPSTGLGLNLHYKDLISLNFNWAIFAGGELVDHNESFDIGFNVDIPKTLKYLRQ